MLRTFFCRALHPSFAMRQSLSRRRFLAGAGAACTAGAALSGSARAAQRPEPVENAVPADASVEAEAARQPDDLEALVDDLVETSLADHDVPGATVAVVADGEIALTKGYGTADRDSGDPVDPAGTPFRIGSVSKAVTATALAPLVHRGDLDPDADVRDVLDVPIDDSYDDPVTLRHLLTHRAGFESTNQGLWIPPDRTVRSLESYLRDGQRARVRPPGEAGSYSNYGYALAGTVLGAHHGQPFHAAIDDRLLDPAGMTSSSFQQPLPDDLADAHATGYGPLGPSRDGRFPSVGLRPAGAMSSTAADMARFLQLHLNDGVVDGERVLASGVVDTAHEQWATHHDALDGMAPGFVEDTRGDVRTLWHNGATPGFYSHLVLVPDHDLGFFIAYNGQNGATAANDVVDPFLEAFVPAPDDRTLTPDGQPARAADLPGTYRFLQQSHTWHDSITSVLNAPTIEVSVADDGALVTSDGSTTTRWVEREPLVFERTDGADRLAFGERDGEIQYLFRGGSPTAYGRVTGLDRLWLHGAIALATVVGMLSGTIGWPAAALWRGIRGNDAHADAHADADSPGFDPMDWLGAPATRARLVAGTAPVLLLAFPVAALLHLAIDVYGTLSDPPLTFAVLFALPLCGLLCGIVSAAYAGRSWLDGYWSTLGRLHYALVAASLLGYCWLLRYWNLLLPPGW